MKNKEKQLPDSPHIDFRRLIFLFQFCYAHVTRAESGEYKRWHVWWRQIDRHVFATLQRSLKETGAFMQP
jgi:hypothetical protein